ncbi:hypothetical protein CAC42_7007 [Sphaceloma murrayae]|uniref:Methyltransferase domain-containing protein n=1 Tax=Sphaceloma murrayae TaxID=2082308 RepID=A0A2K1QQG7_9PEZI|nr:hypothetical protein CAC42_7007 [Sphaceloma murrayae]
MSIPEETFDENGRAYHRWQRGLYWLPHDETELERLDITFGVIYNEDKLAEPLHSAPLNHEPGQPPRILDIGCGTGFWAMEMADKYPQAEVVGTDIINCQPAEIPRNVSFKPKCNFNDRHWPFGEESFDLIHLSQITACSVNWSELYNNVFRYLRPGEGHIEQIDFDIAPYCREGPLTDDNIILRWYQDLVKASEEGHRPIHYDPTVTDFNLKKAGFTDITYRKIAIPWHYYKEPGENYQIGGTFQVTMVQGDGFESYSMAPFYRTFGWTREQIKGYCALVKSEVARTELHLFSYL